MAKTKKRANTKGAAKKTAPKKAQAKKKGLRAPTKDKQRTVTVHKTTAHGKTEAAAFDPLSVSRCTIDLREYADETIRAASKNIEAHRELRLRGAHFTVEEQHELNQRMARAVQALDEPKRKRFRFRDAITGLFVRARDALRRKRTTVRELVK